MPTTSPFIALLLTLISSVPAIAGNWRTVAETETVRTEIDISTLSRNGDIVKAWEKDSYRKPEQARLGDFYFKSTKSLAQHHCANRTTAYLFKAYYGEDGREIKAITYPGDLERIDLMPPDSLEERKLLFACNFKSDITPRIKAPLPPPLVETPAPDKKPPPLVKAPEKAALPALPKQAKTSAPTEKPSPSAAKTAGGK